ncbi:Protein GrpE [Linum grandiflorum]
MAMMSISNPTIFSSPPRSLSAHKTLNSTSSPSSSLFFSFLPHKPLHGLNSTSSSPALSPLLSNNNNYIHGSRSLIPRCAPNQAASVDSATLMNEEEGNPQNDVKDTEKEEEDSVASESKEEQGEGEPESIPQKESGLKNLIASFREAILSGDEEAASKIEAKMNDIEVNVDSELIEKLSALSAEVTSGRDRYIRLQADFANFRKRSENEKLNIRSDAQGAVIESLLPMVDSFERAKQQLKPETDKEKQIDASYQGIYKQFLEIMKGLQVTAVPTVGQPFDPSVRQQFLPGIVRNWLSSFVLLYKGISKRLRI